MSAVVLDASALIAMLRGERGAAKVAGAIADARIDAASYSEAVGHFVHAGMDASQVDAMLGPLPMTIVPVDPLLAREAGRLRATAAGLGLAGRCCLALARQDGLPAWTGDPAWKALADAIQVKVVTIR